MKKFGVGKLLLVVIMILVLMTAPFLMGAAPAGEGFHFFEGYSAEALYLLVVSALFGLSQGLWPGVSLYNLVKNWLKLKDRAAHYLVLGMSGLLAAAALWVTGEIDFAGLDLTLMNLLALGGVIYEMSQIGFQRFKAVRPPE